MKNQKGITLIALIITIIVMVILAGIALIFTVGEEGVLSQAQNSVSTNKNEEVEENVLLAWSACKNEYLASNKGEDESTYFTVEKLNENLTKGEVTDVSQNANGDSEVVYKLDGKYYKVQITSAGMINILEGPLDTQPTLTPSTLLSQINVTNYGDYVNYEVDLGIATAKQALSDGKLPITDWRIFYADANNVYLIASDYLPVRKFPEGVFGKKYNSYNGYWADDSEDTTKLTTSGSVTANTNFLFTGLSNIKTTNKNYQAVATLLDSSKWKGFAKTGYVDDVNTAVIGSPTVEMWMESWNDKYGDALAFDANAKGYQVGLTASSLSTSISSSNMQVKEGWSNTLYYPHASTSSKWKYCYGYWLASPSANFDSNVMAVNYAGNVGGYHYKCWSNIHNGVRPVVALKSGITATQDENNVWQLGNNE